MLYKGYFSDANRRRYGVEIITNASSSEQTDILLGTDPCVIEQVSDGMFSPIKSRICRINIVTNSVFVDMYSPYAHGVEVNVKDLDNDVVLFHGYNTPAVYNQGYAHRLETISLEAVDALSTLRNIKYSTANLGVTDVLRCDAIVSRLLNLAGCPSSFYYPKTLTVDSSDNAMEKIYLNEANFFDDDSEKTPWTCYDVLSEITRYLGWSVVRYNNDTYFIDYLNTSANNTANYIYYNNGTSSAVTINTAQQIDANDYLGDDTNISEEDNFNKIEISQNAYNIGSIPSISDDSNISSVTVEAGLGSGGYNYSKTEAKKWYQTGSDTVYNYVDFRTFFRAKPSSGWTHYYNGIEADSEDDYFYGSTALKPYAAGSTSMTWNVNQNINTQCCLLQKYAGYDASKGGKAPSSLGWTTCLTFFNFNDTKGSFVPSSFNLLPVLKYTSPYKVRYSPVSAGDTSFITIKGDLWFQTTCSNGKKGNKKRSFSVLSDDGHSYYVTPNEGFNDVEPYNYKVESGGGSSMSMITRKPGDIGYGTGWAFIKARLKIGDKYWNGNGWTTTTSDFIISYNNSPGAGEDEHAYCLEWLSPVANYTYSAKVTEDCYAIPITSSDNVHGQLEFTLYSAAFPISNSPWSIEWYNSFPVVFMKDFALGFSFANQKPWYLDTGTNQYNDDIMFTHSIDEDYCTDAYANTLKINSFVDDDDLQSTISLSHALTPTGYVQLVKHKNLSTNKLQEFNLLDIYLSHYKQPKRVYNSTLKGNYDPRNKYTFTAIGGTYVLDSYSYNLNTRQNTIKFIEY